MATPPAFLQQRFVSVLVLLLPAWLLLCAAETLVDLCPSAPGTVKTFTNGWHVSDSDGDIIDDHYLVSWYSDGSAQAFQEENGVPLKQGPTSPAECRHYCIWRSTSAGVFDKYYFYELFTLQSGTKLCGCGRNICTLSQPPESPTYSAAYGGGGTGYSDPVVAAVIGTFNTPDGTVGGDPHFVGAHGTHFDFNGELNTPYCLVTDENININGLLDGYRSDSTVGASVGADGKATRSWIKELGVMWKDEAGASHSLHLVARRGKGARRGSGFLASATLDGVHVDNLGKVGEVISSGGLTLTFLGTVSKLHHDVDSFTLSIKGLADLGIQILPAKRNFQLPEDSEVHFDLSINSLKSSSLVHGILGQTFRNTPSQLFKAFKYSALAKLLGEPIKADGATGLGFLDETVQSYSASHVLKPDCKFSSFKI